MRRLTSGDVLAMAAGAGLAGTRSFAFVAPAHPPFPPTRRPVRIVHVEHVGFRCPVSVRPAQQQHRAQRGGGGRDEAYREDDQRRFWDTAVKVLTQELGTGDELSRVWDFVRHNRDGEDPPAESPSYRATGMYFPGLEAKPWWDRSEFSWLQDLEDAAPDITLEMEALARAGGGAPYRGGSGEMSTVYDATQGWGTMRLRYMGRFGQPGINYSLLPRTLSALRRLPLAPETAAFQRQLPGTGLPLHVDPSNFVLGCHLGVVIPSPAGPVPVAAAASNNVRAGGSRAVDDRRRRRQNKKSLGRRRASDGGASGATGGGGFGFGGSGSRVSPVAGGEGEGGSGGAGGDEAESVAGGGGGSSAMKAAGSGGAPPGREGDGDGGGDGNQREESRERSSTSTAYRPPGNGKGGGGGGDDGVEEVVVGEAEAEAEAAGGCSAAAAVGAEQTEKSGDPVPSCDAVVGGGIGGGGGIVGERAWIEVSGEKRHWHTGRAFVFDPSFLHRTHNPTAGERVILNIDVWHPGLEEVERTAIRRVCEMVEEWNTRTGLFE